MSSVSTGGCGNVVFSVVFLDSSVHWRMWKACVAKGDQRRDIQDLLKFGILKQALANCGFCLWIQSN